MKEVRVNDLQYAYELLIEAKSLIEKSAYSDELFQIISSIKEDIEAENKKHKQKLNYNKKDKTNYQRAICLLIIGFLKQYPNNCNINGSLKEVLRKEISERCKATKFDKELFTSWLVLKGRDSEIAKSLIKNIHAIIINKFVKQNKKFIIKYS